MSEIEKKWAKQAEQTMALRKAQEYLKTPPTPHTSNKWITSEYGWHEMSNMVYKFIWHIYENQRWSQEKQTSVTTSFDLSWYLSYNTPHNPDDSGPGRQIAGQERKHFGERADLDRYLQGRINAYAHLFTEVSPPYSVRPEETLLRQWGTAARLYRRGHEGAEGIRSTGASD